MKKVSDILAVFVTAPIWFYILFQVLTAINASELTWFLYWVYVPVGLLVQLISKLVAESN